MPQKAYAAGETFTFTDANTIVAKGSADNAGSPGVDWGSNLTLTFTRSSDGLYRATWTRGRPPVDTTYAISGFTQRADGSYSATIISGDGTGSLNNTTIQIKDPNDVGPADGTTADPDPAATTADADKGDGCPIAESDRSRWIMCPVFRAVSKFMETLDSFINSYMSMDNVIFSSQESSYYKAWQTFRNLAIGLVVIAGMVMLASEALGWSIIDAYTVRKVLPRLLIAIIGISISWEFCKFIISFFDDLGHAAGSIIYTSFDVGDQGISVFSVIMAQVLIVGAAAPAAVLLTGMGIISLFGTLVMAMMVAAVVLIVRQAIIIAAVILSPLAIAAYILPNTSKMYSFWWDTLKRMLILYPIATGLIALCKVLGKIVMTNPGDGGPAVVGQLIATITGMVLFFAGYALIPLAFRLTGGMVANLAGIANDRTRGGFDSLSNFRKGRTDRQKHKYGGRILSRQARKVGDLQDKANDADRSALGRRYYRGRAWVSGGMSSSANVQARQSARQAEESKELNDQIKTGDDAEIRALTVNKAYADSRFGREGVDWKVEGGRKKYKTLGGAWADESKVLRAQQRWGNNKFAQQTALSYEMRKASEEGEAQGIAENYERLATGVDRAGNKVGGWGMQASDAGNAWMGAAYDNQQQHLEFKRTNWQSGRMTQAGEKQFVDEIYENKGSYPLSQVNSNTLDQLGGIHDRNAAVLGRGGLSTEDEAKIRNQQARIKAVSETFMSEMGGGGMIPGADGGVEAIVPGTDASGRRFRGSGSAHTNERARALAEKTGSLGSAPSGNYDPAAHTGVHTPNGREQS
jgi:hypothetical protein